MLKIVYDIKPHGWLLQVDVLFQLSVVSSFEPAWLHSRCDPCVLLHSFAKHLERIGGGEAPVDLSSGCSALWQMSCAIHEDMIGRANNIYTTFDPVHTVSLGRGPRFKIRASSGSIEAKSKNSAGCSKDGAPWSSGVFQLSLFENLFWAKHFRSQRYLWD